jgi:predicted amidohydrolase YtcJ
MTKQACLDMAIINANVITVDKKKPKAEAIGVIGDRIAAIGTTKEIKAMTSDHTEIIDAKGKTVLPGFHDSHMHPLLVGHFANGVVLNETKNIPEFLQRIKDKAAKTPKGQIILGSGWNQERMEEKRYPTRWEVDSVAPDHPVFLIHWNAHIYLINTLMLNQKGITKNTPDPEGGSIEKNEKGEPTGILLENALNLVAPGFLETGAGLFSYEQSKAALEFAAKRAASYGLTSMVDILAGDAQVKAYQELEKEGKLPVRVNFYLAYPYLDDLVRIGMMSGFGSNKVRFAGVKMITDGSLSSHTAALKAPYVDMPNNSGIMRNSKKEIKEVVLKATKNGIRVDIHALGDRAIAEVLDVFEDVKKETKVKDPRFKISHAFILDKDIIKKFKQLNVIANVQPVFLMKGQNWIPKLVGPEREKTAHVYRSLMAAGVHMATGTDSPIEPENPMMNLYAATVRKDPNGIPEGGWHPEQKIPMEQAIRMGTIEGAYATGEEEKMGSIEVGKLADFVMLTEDPFKVPGDDVKNIKALMTIVGGEVVWSATTKRSK